MVFGFAILLITSTYEITRKFPGPFPLNQLALSYRPYVFTADFFFSKSSVWMISADDQKFELPLEIVYGLYRPISINRDVYYCTTRFDRLDKNYCQAVARKICQRYYTWKKRTETARLQLKIDYPQGSATRNYECSEIL